jgi:CRP-like cAMP-binding protein
MTRADLIALLEGERKTLRLKAGQVLFKNGDPARSMYVVRSGSIAIRSGLVKYEDVGPGGIFGEMGIVEEHQLCSAMVYAR